MIKKCTKCNLEKDFSCFYKDNNSKDKFAYWCKQCVNNNVKKHRENPEHRKKQMEVNNKWRFRPENREKVLSYRRKSQRKIIEILSKVGFVTKEIREIILSRDNNKCLCCGSIEKLTIDHIKPISGGGITEINNLQTLCRSCNSKKQQKTISYL